MAEQRLTNRSMTIGYLADSISDGGKRRVLDKNRRTAGYISTDSGSQPGTWDANHVRIADWPDAGLLLND